MHLKLTKIANMSKINKYGVPEREELYAYCEYSDIGSKNVPNISYQEKHRKKCKIRRTQNLHSFLV